MADIGSSSQSNLSGLPRLVPGVYRPHRDARVRRCCRTRMQYINRAANTITIIMRLMVSFGIRMDVLRHSGTGGAGHSAGQEIQSKCMARSHECLSDTPSIYRRPLSIPSLTAWPTLSCILGWAALHVLDLP